MLARAVAADPGRTVGWLQLDPGWRTLPLRSASLDAVVAASVLEYTQLPAMVLDEFARVLRPGGFALCTVPDPGHPIRWLESLAIPAARGPLGRAVADRRPRLREYLTYLQVSRQRRPAQWWYALAAKAGLQAITQPAETAEQSPLRLLTFRRPDNDLDTSREQQ